MEERKNIFEILGIVSKKEERTFKFGDGDGLEEKIGDGNGLARRNFLNFLGTGTLLFKSVSVPIFFSFNLAKRVGFEPTVRDERTPVFETGALNHSAISP